MIVKGIVMETEMERIKNALAHHGLVNGRPGDFCTWTNKTREGNEIWVEVDVNDRLAEYLERTGFFDISTEDSVMEIQCPRYGNDNLDEIELHVERPCYTIHSINREPNGAIAAKSESEGRVHHNQSLRSQLFCHRCKTAFDFPGIPLK